MGVGSFLNTRFDMVRVINVIKYLSYDIFASRFLNSVVIDHCGEPIESSGFSRSPSTIPVVQGST